MYDLYQSLSIVYQIEFEPQCRRASAVSSDFSDPLQPTAGCLYELHMKASFCEFTVIWQL